MWHALHLVVRPIEALLGLFCVVTATLLYPGEDGKIQSQLEDVWVQVDDFRDIPVSKHAAFMARVARLETIVLEFMFGNRLFSEQAVAVSLSISFVCAIYAGYLLGDAFGALGAMTGSIGGNVVVMPQITLTRQLYDHRFEVTLALLGVAIGVVAIGLRKSKPFRRRSILGGLVALILLTSYLGGEGAVSYFLIPIAILGFICDMLFIAATRSLLKWAGSMTSALKISVLVILNVSLALMLIAPYFLQYSTEWAQRLDLYIFAAVGLAYSNGFDAALAALFFLLCFLLLLHIVFWPLLTRTLFRIQDIGTKNRRAILTTIGVALLGASLFGGKFPELLAKVIEKFGG